MKRPDPSRVKILRRSVFRWYRRHQRELVWRTTRDPYAILVSEVMLQQTQVSRVQEKLPIFLRQFPTLRSLARAPKARVIRAWQGMGYNNRAVRLRDMARSVVSHHGGRLPSDIDHLQKLPGVGPYTAHAVACFAFGKRVPLVDVNIHRVLSRYFRRMSTTTSLRSEKEMWELATTILPRDAYTWNQALMDLGATVCTAKRPRCTDCPLTSTCPSRNLHLKTTEPLSKTKKTEARYDGVPHRIWRGRIVEILRTVDDHGTLTILSLGKKLKPAFKKTEVRWLSHIVSTLVRDGLAHTIRAGRAGLTTRVSLTQG